MAIDVDPEILKKSFVASTVLSVVRDRSISSAYGLYCAKIEQVGGNQGVVPPIEEFFSGKMSKKLERDISTQLCDSALRDPLYGGEGDLLGQLARLLIVVSTMVEDEALVTAANERIGAIGFEGSLRRGDFIRFLRNAIAHAHIEILPPKHVGESYRIKFTNQKNSEAGSAIVLDSEGLASVINVLVNDVCLSYLRAETRDS